MPATGPYRESFVGFRLLIEDDLPMLRDWLNSGHVMPWYEERPLSLDEVRAHYGPRAQGMSNVTAFIATYDGTSVGYLQRYFPHLEPGYWSDQVFPPDTAGIDLLIGDPNFVHRGFGPVMILAFLRTVVFAEEGVPLCIIDPHPANAAAIRAYEKVGFSYLRTIGPPEHPEPAYLMSIGRSERSTHAVAGHVAEHPPPIG
jgi:aminoglycoside 6'-N-acetyltransferase